jgi:hypothetical protein
MRRKLARLAVAVSATALVAGMSVSTAAADGGPAAPAAGSADVGSGGTAPAAGGTATGKPARPAPERAGPTGAVPGKPAPHRTAASSSPDVVDWQVSLTVDSAYLWIGRVSTLTATANYDVGPTPYYIRIYRNGTRVANCGAGTTCSFQATRSTPGTDWFVAQIADNNGTVVASDPPADGPGRPVTWHTTTVRLAASPTTLPVGGTSTLTATTADDVGPSPYYIEIFDATTSTRLAVCGSGTSCSAQASQTVATTHAYRAFVSSSDTQYPPNGIVATSPTSYVTWTNSGYRLSLAAPATTQSTVPVTATSSVDVGPTPYYIEIYDDDSGARLGICGTGTTCAVTYTPSQSGSHLVAFIAAVTSTSPPTSIQASSNIVTTTKVDVPG